MATPSYTPNPGSEAARDLGCICAVMDNNHGKYLPWTGGWWITQGCPIHAPAEDLAEPPGDPDALISYPQRRASGFRSND